MNSFTADTAKILLLTGSMNELYALKPLSMSIEECVKAALDVAHTNELDYIALMHIGLGRRSGFYMNNGQYVLEETDSDFRERLKRYADGMGNVVNVVNTTNGPVTITLPDAADKRKFIVSCAHQWKTYVGLNQTFDYCAICDEKKS